MDLNYTLEGLQEHDRYLLDGLHNALDPTNPYPIPEPNSDHNKLMLEIQRQGALTRLQVQESFVALARLVAGRDTFEESDFFDE